MDGAEGMRGVGVSWINRGEAGTEAVIGIVDFIGDEDWLTGLIIIFLNVVMKLESYGYFDITHA